MDRDYGCVSVRYIPVYSRYEYIIYLPVLSRYIHVCRYQQYSRFICHFSWAARFIGAHSTCGSCSLNSGDRWCTSHLLLLYGLISTLAWCDAQQPIFARYWYMQSADPSNSGEKQLFLPIQSPNYDTFREKNYPQHDIFSQWITPKNSHPYQIVYS